METQLPDPMNSSQALDVLYAAESRVSEQFSRVVSLMAPSNFKSLLIPSQRQLGGDKFNALWEKSTKSAEHFRVKRRITDWVFENFWMNPHEPKHSKLLAYFMNPDEEHGCGKFLLTTFCEGLNKALKIKHPNEQHIQTDCLQQCKVYPEKGKIDVSITCNCADNKWAVIIENKINNAKNQDRQLERYVNLRCREGYKRIFVFYLPRSSEKEPDSGEVQAIKKLEIEFKASICYKKITFEGEILSWLDTSLQSWPQELNLDLREHLSYYRRLVAYLVNLNKQNDMDSAILDSIRKTEEAGGYLTLEAIDAAITSAASLRRVFERVLRVRLIRRIYNELLKHNMQPHYYGDYRPKLRKVYPVSDYTTDFDEGIIVAIVVNAAISVGFGWDKSALFFGYLRLNDECGKFDESVKTAARVFFGETELGNKDIPYYAWKYENLKAELLQSENTAADIAMKISGMREGLLAGTQDTRINLGTS